MFLNYVDDAWHTYQYIFQYEMLKICSYFGFIGATIVKDKFANYISLDNPFFKLYQTIKCDKNVSSIRDCKTIPAIKFDLKT